MQQRRLVLVRHAQAADAPVDADRPLTGSGARRAAAIGAWLAAAGLSPDRVLVSPARRTVQTWEQASRSLPAALPPVVDERIYDNTVEGLLATFQETPAEVRLLVLVGHNPAVHELATVLDDREGDPAAGREVGAGFPTGGVAVFTLSTDFAALEPGTATLDDVAVPGG